MATCETCQDTHHIAVAVSVARCCERAVYECGGRGCIGPVEDCDWQWETCPDCTPPAGEHQPQEPTHA